MVNPKRKGSSFELMIYRDLRELGECKRTIGSGSGDEPGDILFKTYAIECKHLKKVRYTELNKFWDKLKKECEATLKLLGGGDIKIKTYEPIIVFRQNREPIMVMTVAKVEGKYVRCIILYNVWKQLVR